MADVKAFDVRVALVQPADPNETPTEVDVEIRAPGEGGVSWHWYPQVEDFNKRAARRFLGVEGLSFAEDDRDDIIDAISASVRRVQGLSFPADKPKAKDDGGGEAEGE